MHQVQEIELVAKYTKLEMQNQAGLFFDDQAWDLLVEEDADVYAKDMVTSLRGELLAKYRREIIPLDMAQAAYQGLRGATKNIRTNRGMATGGSDLETNSSAYIVRKDGKRSRTNLAHKQVETGLVGFFDRYARTPYCRQTAYTMENPEKFMAALPMLKFASETFQQLVPERFSAQKSFVERTHPDFLIPGTVFTTITVNRNWQTAMHQDAGDCRAGLGVMAVFGQGWKGAYYLFPKYRVGFNVRNRDLIFSNVHEWHCNTPIQVADGGERISCILYYRENMEKCGSAVEELHRAKNREEGDSLYEATTPLFES